MSHVMSIARFLWACIYSFDHEEEGGMVRVVNLSCLQPHVNSVMPVHNLILTLLCLQPLQRHFNSVVQDCGECTTTLLCIISVLPSQPGGLSCVTLWMVVVVVVVLVIGDDAGWGWSVHVWCIKWVCLKEQMATVQKVKQEGFSDTRC